jgi:hypothetical protein
MQNRHELGECWSSLESIVCSLKISHLEPYSFSSEILPSPKDYRKGDMTDGRHCCTGDYTMKRSPTGAQKRSRQPHMVESHQKKVVEGAASIYEHSVELNILYEGVDYQGIPPRLWYKVRVVTAVEGNGDLGPSKVLRGGGFDRHDLPSCEFLLPLGLIRARDTKNVVRLFMGLGQVTLGILRLLLLIGHLDHLEKLIYKTLELVTVSGFVLSLGMKNANAIQEVFEFAQPRPVLLMTTKPFYRVDRMVRFSLLIVALG